MSSYDNGKVSNMADDKNAAIEIIASHEQNVALTSSSVDDILDVTPVHSLDNGEHETTPSDKPRNNNDNAFSSSSDDHDDISDEEDSQYSSSSTSSYLSSDEGEHQSEWDKALQAGKPSTGRAADFFHAKSQESAASPNSRAIISSAVVPTSPQGSVPPATASIGGFPSISISSAHSSVVLPSNSTGLSTAPSMRPHPNEDLSAGVLPDVFLSMRQKIESLTLFDSDMLRIAGDQTAGCNDDDPAESRETLKRSSQQSISAAVLVSLAHKRYERRRLAAMEIEKIVRSLVSQSMQKPRGEQQQQQLDRVRAILLLLSDDYVRSTAEDARKGGVVALAACAIGLKKGQDSDPLVQECRDLILASVVHACQDHSQRVRYYATESLFNVVKVIPGVAIQHFFILFEILRSLYADVDADVRSGADLLDKKLKEVIISAMNLGTFSADACVPVFARFVHVRNKATKLLTLTWLQELNENLIGAPILEFLHLFLGGIYDMVADPTVAIRQSALAFLQSVLPKLLVVNSSAETGDDLNGNGMKVDFDKILQSLVTTMEHPDPFVRKVAIYWMSRIVKAHMVPDEFAGIENESGHKHLSAASVSVRNSVPHVLPGILLR
jgi:hypothetical protein